MFYQGESKRIATARRSIKAIARWSCRPGDGVATGAGGDVSGGAGTAKAWRTRNRGAASRDMNPVARLRGNVSKITRHPYPAWQLNRRWLSMRYRASITMLLATLVAAVTAQTALCESARMHVVFTGPSGGVIVLDARTGLLRTPYSQGVVLQDCSDAFQFCLTDHQGFSFAYFRRCSSAGYDGGNSRLRFHPKILSVLHGNLWLVFDDAPKYMFHYVDSKGLVGIYVGSTPSFDFRNKFHDRNFRMSDLDAMEYRISGSDGIAACSA